MPQIFRKNATKMSQRRHLKSWIFWNFWWKQIALFAFLSALRSFICKNLKSTNSFYCNGYSALENHLKSPKAGCVSLEVVFFTSCFFQNSTVRTCTNARHNPIIRFIIEELDTFYQLSIDKKPDAIKTKTISRCLILPVERIMGSIVPIIFDLCNGPFKKKISQRFFLAFGLSQHLAVINFNLVWTQFIVSGNLVFVSVCVCVCVRVCDE